jgi:hypothetical protein
VIHVGGTVHVAGCPADVTHGAVRIIVVVVMATAGSVAPGQVQGMLWLRRLEPVTHLGGTNELLTRIHHA